MTLDRVIEELRRTPEPWDEHELEKKMWRILRPRVAIGLGVYVAWSWLAPDMLGIPEGLALTAFLYAGKLTALGVALWPVVRLQLMSERELDRRLRVSR